MSEEISATGSEGSEKGTGTDTRRDTDTEESDRVLKPGELVVDSEGTDDEAVVLHTPEMTVDEWEVTDSETVADHNPEYSEDENVVIAAFVEGDGVTGMEEWDGWRDTNPYSLFDGAVEKGVKFYAFPESRLEAVGENALSLDAEETDDKTDETKTRLEKIHSGLVEQGWDSAEIDDERQVVVVEKFGEYVIHPDGRVDGDGTLREKLELAVEGVV
ncbi:MAG: hypothetical protein SV253_08025 [Halobacteria archaeon]|nr:hypothetical protein [Halobacteria archaeon]